jgi:hypothetical protein
MGLVEQLPPELLQFLTWLIVWFAACSIVLALCLGLGRWFGEFVSDVIGRFK